MDLKRVRFTLVLLLACREASGALEVIASSNPAAAGQSVTLSLSSDTTLNSGSWAVGGVLILTWTGQQVAVFSNHSGRVSMDANRALTLDSLSEHDSGLYTMESTDPELSASLSLTVLDPISNVSANASDARLIENSGEAVASCSVASGSSVSLAWFNGSSQVKANPRVRLSEGNATLTIVQVNRHDRRPFTCTGSNPVSNGTSNAVRFNVCYGPDNLNLTLGSHASGSNVTAVCSAESYPPAQTQWAFGDQLLNVTGPVLELYNVSTDQSGPYTCIAFNNETNLRHNITGLLEIKGGNSGLQPTPVWLHLLLSISGMLYHFY